MKIEDAGEGPRGYSKEDFETDSRAVCVAGDDPSAGMVLWYDGAWLDVEINEVGQGFMLEDLGLHEAPAGVSIWTGRYVTTEYDSPEYGRDYDTEAVGTFRELTPAEWLVFMKGENPLETEADDALFEVVKVLDGKVQRLKIEIGPDEHPECGTWSGEGDVLTDISEVMGAFKSAAESKPKLPTVAVVCGVKVVPGDNEP